MRFVKTYGRGALTALAYAYNDEFSRVLHQQMEYFSSNPNADTINRVKGEIAEVSLAVLWRTCDSRWFLRKCRFLTLSARSLSGAVLVCQALNRVIWKLSFQVICNCLGIKTEVV